MWGWFWDLDNSRQSDQGTPQPLTYQEIKAWRDLCEVEAVSWDMTVLKAMDIAFLKAYSAEKRAQEARKKAREESMKQLGK